MDETQATVVEVLEQRAECSFPSVAAVLRNALAGNTFPINVVMGEILEATYHCLHQTDTLKKLRMQNGIVLRFPYAESLDDALRRKFEEEILTKMLDHPEVQKSVGRRQVLSFTVHGTPMGDDAHCRVAGTLEVQKRGTKELQKIGPVQLGHIHLRFR